MQAADVIQTQIPYTVSADANDYVVRVSRMSPDDLATTFHLFLRRLTLVKEKIPYLKAAGTRLTVYVSTSIPKTRLTLPSPWN